MTPAETTPFSESEVRAVCAKLEAWARTLESREQRCLAALLMPPDQASGGDVEGYAANAGLMGSVLTNIANMKHESLKRIAQNLR
jgi:hypothetical protein